MIGPCASVSLVGRNIRAILHQLGEAFELFADQRIYLLSQAANDLNFTFVVDEDQGDRLVERAARAADPAGAQRTRCSGRPGSSCSRRRRRPQPRRRRWWRARRERAARARDQHDCAYVYEPRVVARGCARCSALKRGRSRALRHEGQSASPRSCGCWRPQGVGFECVSRGEIEHLLACVPELVAQRILFTPNFAPREEYLWALEQDITLTLDNLYLLRQWGELFRGRSVFMRVDTGTGRGHHHHVRTAGAHAKFGVPLEQTSTSCSG